MSEVEKGKRKLLDKNYQANAWPPAAPSLLDTGLRLSFGPGDGTQGLRVLSTAQYLSHIPWPWILVLIWNSEKIPDTSLRYILDKYLNLSESIL